MPRGDGGDQQPNHGKVHWPGRGGGNPPGFGNGGHEQGAHLLRPHAGALDGVEEDGSPLPRD
eukprot:447365-Heterocapsa_arctica.AAC.1